MAARRIAWAGFGIVFVFVAGACAGAAAPTAAPTVAVAANPPAPSPSPALADLAVPSEAAQPSDSPAPISSASRAPLPSFDQAQLSAYLTSSITLIDLADDDLSVDVSYLDPSSDQSVSLGSYALGATDQMTNQVPPGTYRLVFHQPAGSSNGPICTIEVTDAGGYIFAAIPGAIAISRTGSRPKDAGDLFVATSSLCRK